MKLLYILNFIGFSFLMSSDGCGAEYINNSRIYVEGKITSSGNNSVGNIPVKLENEDILVSHGTTKNDGTFSLGGPGTTHQTSLAFNKKIENFSANIDGCELNYDSLAIILPENSNYIKFTNIRLE